MLDVLYRHCLQVGLIGGVAARRGWGQAVRSKVLPLLGHPKLKHHAGIIREGFERAADPISVFVVGEGKFGKSSLINALVRRPVAFVDFLPATRHITRYLPATGESLCQVRYDPTTAGAGAFEEWQELRLHRDWQRGRVTFADARNLEQLMAREDERVKKTKTLSAVREVLLTLPEDSAATRIEIVDTPGLNQMLEGAIDPQTIDDFYHRADVVLWLMVADKLNSNDTRETLHKQARYGKPILAVVNRADEIRTRADRERAERTIQKEFGGLVREVVFVSARNAFQAAQRGDEPGYRASGLPELCQAIERLAIEQGPRTKALSLYTTSKQAAHEAGVILRQEADVLEANLERYGRNRAAARRFTEKGREVVRSVTAGAAHRIVLQAAPVMARTANIAGPDYQEVYDEAAVTREIESVAQQIIEQLNEALVQALASIQDEIAACSYAEQTYAGDAQVRAHGSTTSFALRLDGVASRVSVPAIPPVASLLGDLIVVVGQFIDWVLLKWYEMMSDHAGVAWVKESGRQRARQARYDAFQRGLPTAAEHVITQIREAADVAVSVTTLTLTGEVERCFEAVFGTEAVAIADVHRYRAEADAAVVPPPFLHTLTRILGAA